jgi:selenocysteine lyase/cysteine desulfurase
MQKMTQLQYKFEATGSVAHERISPLLTSDECEWIDASSKTENEQHPPDFLWENAPRLQTKAYRDMVKVYSHLPNGTAILDCKWVLGRLFAEPQNGDGELLATLETHCFRGPEGFETFGKSINLFDTCSSTPLIKKQKLPDILLSSEETHAEEPYKLWVIKDAQANGAGGIWVVGPENASDFLESGHMFPDHRYVAQKYVWPPVLFGGRKSHVRVYALFTADGRAFVHSRAFLHVANDPFVTNATCGEGFQDSIHITNCCANSHDTSKFAGEILASFLTDEETERDGQPVIPLKQFFPSIQDSVSALAKRSFPFLQGGKRNHGFEYLGLDYILSEDSKKNPVAYLLEINAPPSQDTATGLLHAENLHNEVIRDLIHLWVLPNVIPGAPEALGGWNCVYQEKSRFNPDRNSKELIVPSKAAIINKIRWAIFERKAIKKEYQEKATEEQDQTKKGTRLNHNLDDLSRFARSQFPFFEHCSASCNQQIFFENAGGSQVAQAVIKNMNNSLSFRHRSVVGTVTKRVARTTFQRILGATKSDPIILGPNASSLLAILAEMYIHLGLLIASDEIIISTENHQANVQPWQQAAKMVGAKIRWWSPFESTSENSLKDLVSCKTRIVALPHASNVLGQVRDICSSIKLINEHSEGRAHVVVDGVAAAPHWFANVEKLKADWYVVSGHKLFGPHLGALYGRRTGAVKFFPAGSPVSTGNSDEMPIFSLLERGTVNYEGCAGIVGVGAYFEQLASFFPFSSQEKDFLTLRGQACSESPSNGGILQSMLGMTKKVTLSTSQLREAYYRIQLMEEPLVRALVNGVKQFSRVRVLEGKHNVEEQVVARLPILSFIHQAIQARTIHDILTKKGISCRVSSFLCTEKFANHFMFDRSEGFLRVSLAHYNTLEEVDTFLKVLSSIPGW